MGSHLFACGGGCRQQIHPSISQVRQKKWELADPPDHLIVFSPCSNKLKESPEESTLSSLLVEILG